MEEPKKPIKLSPAERENLKLQIAKKAKNDPEFKAKVDQMVADRKLKNNQDKEKD